MKRRDKSSYNKDLLSEIMIKLVCTFRNSWLRIKNRKTMSHPER